MGSRGLAVLGLKGLVFTGASRVVGLGDFKALGFLGLSASEGFRLLLVRL